MKKIISHKTSSRIPKTLWVVAFLLISMSSWVHAQTFQCESFTSQSGVSISTANTGFTGTGFADTGATGTWFELNNVNVAAAGAYELTIRYANGGTTARAAQITVNGVAGATNDFMGATTGNSWTTWVTVAIPNVVLNAGNNTIRLTVTGASGANYDSYTLVSTAPDLEKPTVPSSLVSSAIAQSSFTLSWAASTDNIGVASYEVFANGVSKGTTTAAVLTLNITGLTPATTYSMTVKAKDASGNVSDASASLSVATTAPDTQAPTVPSSLNASSVASNSFSLSWSASSDNVGVDHYEIFANGISKGNASSTSRNVSGLIPETSYVMTVKAFDAAGNASAASSSITVTTTKEVISTFDESKNYMGIGLSSMAEWEKVFLFANCMVNSKATYSTGAILSADDWPMNNCSVSIGSGMDKLDGRYRIIFEGNQGDVKISRSTEVVGSRSYDPVRNETSFLTDVTDQTSFNMLANFTVVSGTTLRNVRIYRPTFPGSTEAHDTTEIFHRRTMEILSKFNYLRSMDFTSTNHNAIENWSDRNVIGQRAQNKTVINPYKYNNELAVGGAWEYLVLMSNALKKDLWICIPAHANDDYVRKLAQLFKYGSDGVNPYTSVQANPKYPPLDPSLNLMIEYSNETWNGMFAQYSYTQAKAAELGIGGHNQYTALRTAQVSLIFREVFGDAQMMTRIRPLLEWQKAGLDKFGNGSNSGSDRLFWMEKNMPMPVDYYVWGGGCSGYYNPCAGCTVSNVWNGCGMETMSWTYESQEYAAYFTSAYGMRRVVYEGGPSFGDVNGGNGMEANAPAIMLDPRIGDEVIEHQEEWYKAGGNAFTYFCLAGDERWGFCQHPTVTNPKYDGIVAMYNQPRPAITTGYGVYSETTPTIIPGNQWRLYNKSGYAFRNTAISNASYTITDINCWHSYHFNVDEQTNPYLQYKVRVNYTTTGSGTLNIYHGSTLKATVTLTSGTNKSTEWIDLTDVNPYLLHAIKLEAKSGTLPTIVSVEMKKYHPSTGNSQNLDSKQTMVYPTDLRAGQSLKIDNSNLSSPIDVLIYTQTGMMVYKANQFTGKIEINASELPKGILLCTIKDAKETKTVKLSNL